MRASPVAVAVVLRPLALLRALTGDFAEARRLIAEANAILGELGRLHSVVTHHEAQVEMVAGAPAAAAARLEADMARLEAVGERAMLATTAAMLAQARDAEGRHEEAQALSETSERCAAPDDLSTQTMWRGVRAQALARRGPTTRPRRSPARRSPSIAPSDALTDQGDALLALAEILDLRGRPAEAAAARAGSSATAARERSCWRWRGPPCSAPNDESTEETMPKSEFDSPLTVEGGRVAVSGVVDPETARQGRGGFGRRPLGDRAGRPRRPRPGPTRTAPGSPTGRRARSRGSRAPRTSPG